MINDNMQVLFPATCKCGKYDGDSWQVTNPDKPLDEWISHCRICNETWKSSDFATHIKRKNSVGAWEIILDKSL